MKAPMKNKTKVPKAERLFYEKLLAVFPRNWVDPLLSGPDAVLGKPPWGCPDIERLLQKIEARQYALMSEHISQARATMPGDKGGRE